MNSYTGLVEIQLVHPLGLTANVLFQNSVLDNVTLDYSPGIWEPEGGGF